MSKRFAGSIIACTTLFVSSTAWAGGDTKIVVNASGQTAFVRSPADDEALQCFGGSDAGDPCFNDTDCTDGNCRTATPNAGLDLILRTGASETVLASNGDPLTAPGDPTLSGFAKALSINDSGVVAVRVGLRRMRCEGGTNDDDPCTANGDCPGGTCEFASSGGQCDSGPNAGNICDPTSVSPCAAPGTCIADPAFDSDNRDGAIVTAAANNTATLRAATGDTIGGQTIDQPDPDPLINDAGQVGFTADVSPGDRALFRFTPGTGVELICVNGDLVGGVTINEIDSLLGMNASGQLLIEAATSGGNDALILITSAASKTIVAREGVDYDDIEKGVLNDAGQVLFKGCNNANCGSSDNAEERMVLFTPGDGLEEIAVEGTDAGGGADFGGFPRFYDLNNNGQAAFIGGLARGTCVGGADAGDLCQADFECDSGECSVVCDPANQAVNNPHCQGVFFWNGAQLQQVAQTPTAQNGGAPTSSSGLTFDWFGAGVAINDAGSVCFFAEENVAGAQCRGGPDAGTSCTVNDDCTSTCAGGPNAGMPCSSGTDCPTSSCTSFNCNIAACVGGANAGDSCISGGDCDSGMCSTAICRSGPNEGAPCNDSATDCMGFFCEEPENESGMVCWNGTTGLQVVARDGDAVNGNDDTQVAPSFPTFARMLNDGGTLAVEYDVAGDEFGDPEGGGGFRLPQILQMASVSAPALAAGASVLAVTILFGVGLQSLLRRRR